jgi:hypothetical protein
MSHQANFFPGLPERIFRTKNPIFGTFFGDLGMEKFDKFYGYLVFLRTFGVFYI